MAQKLKNSDSVMKEIHRIRRDLANDLKAYSWNKWYKKLIETNNQFLKDKGFKLVKDRQGQTRIAKHSI